MINLLTLGRQTSGYGPRNTGIAGASRWHRGVDIVLTDKNIPAAVAGKVIVNSYNSARGNYITIQDASGYQHTYQHMAARSPLSVGTSVNEGQKIGIMGNTGVGSGAHLHYEVKNEKGAYLNPIEYLKKGIAGVKAKDDGTYSNASSTSDSVAMSSSGSSKGFFASIAEKIMIGAIVILVIVLGFLLLTKAFDLKL